MTLNLADVFDEYPNPVYIIKPIIEHGVSEDFTYIYVNKAFSSFVGKKSENLIGHSYLENFTEGGERLWLDLFRDIALEKKHTYVDNVSMVIRKKLYTELFHIYPDMCGCIIHDFQEIAEDLSAQNDAELWNKAHCDYLTGFYNRFYLNEIYADISKKTNVGITYLDINDLKIINNTLGHKQGDNHILRITNIIRSRYGNSLLFRLGGDEFLIITVETNKKDFTELSKSTQKVFEFDNLVAIGYNFYEKIDNLKECIDYCDRLMYRQKRKMKNQSII